MDMAMLVVLSRGVGAGIRRSSRRAVLQDRTQTAASEERVKAE